MHTSATTARRATARNASVRPRHAHIDGLRAIAVLSVVFAHAGFTLFGGGWIGVDVFFVISGYLITGIVIRESRAGTFSFRRFYMRRVRRILPALTLVVACCFPLAWWLMFPDFIQNFGQSAFASILGLNNLLLAVTSGYWELESGFKPLLHTWSLGVEEQFYLLYPLMLAILLWLTRRNTKALVLALAVLAAASLGLAQHAVQSSPDSAFYLPQYRAWELLLGAIAAFVRPTGRRLERHLPIVGLAGVVGSVLFFREGTPSPSVWLVIPTVSTALILVWGGAAGRVSRALSVRPLVTIGLISYSAYLIHQPVYAFVRVGSLHEPSPWLLGALIVPILGLSWLCWRYVEEPFRDPTRISARRLAAVLIPSTAGIAALGLTLHVNEGFPERAFPNIEAGGDVYISYNESIRELTIGTDGAPPAPDVVVVGNSFGRDAANVLLEANPLLAGRLGYAPSLDTAGLDSAIGPDTVVVLAVQSATSSEVNAQLEVLDSYDARDVHVFGPKNFGWNLNPFARVPLEDRADVRTEISDQIVVMNDALAAEVPDYVDVIRLLGEDGRSVAVFDQLGNPLSPDRVHLTKYGAQFVADRLVKTDSPLADLD